MVLQKFESSFNVAVLLSALLVLMAVINLALWNAPIELLQTVFVLNLLVQILTLDFRRIASIIPFVSSMQTPVPVWILFVLKLLLVVVIISRI